MCLFLLIDIIVAFDYTAVYVRTRDPLVLTLLALSVAAAATRIRYCWFLRETDDESRPRRAWTIALFAPTVISWLIAFAAPQYSAYASMQLWFSAIVYAAALPRTRPRWAAVGLAALLTLLPTFLATSRGAEPWAQFVAGSSSIILVTYAVLLPFMIFTSLWLWRVVHRLDDARLLAADFAIAQERLRFAADLHDIQGHHLQVIALKAELAERTLDSDPLHASEQVREIRLIAKEAMEGTRSLVAGLREVELTDELRNASEVLTLAGAACELRMSGAPKHLPTQRVLAFAVREATTNILRHAQATEAAIVLGPERGGFALTVTNNGVPDTPPDTAGGSGLAGLRDRVSSVSGTMNTSLRVTTPPGSAQFELRVWVPGAAARAQETQ